MKVVTKRTFCRFCHAACPLEVDVDTDRNRIVAVRPDNNDPIFGGYTCIKGRHLADQHHHEGRLRQSLKRMPDGSFAPMETARALDEIAERLKAIMAEHGPRAIASYCGTATYQNTAALPVIRAFHRAIGSPSFYTSLTIDQPAKIVAPLRHGSWMAGVPPFATADVSLVVGLNTPVSMFSQPGGPTFVNPIANIRAARKRGWKLIVIDPRITEMAHLADIHLRVRPGEDPTLLAGMLKVILAEGLHDQEFCDRWVTGVDELHAALEGFDPAYVAHRTGVPADDMIAAAQLFGTGPRGNATCGTGPNMAPRGTLMEHLVQCFNTLGGRYARAGEWLPNPGGMLGFRRAWAPPKAQPHPPNIDLIEKGLLARVRNLHHLAGEGPTAALADEILEPGEGQVRALFSVGGNPVVAWPDQLKTVKALRSLDLHVALDVVVSSTASLADYVLAGELSLERPDVPTNVDRWFEEPYTMYTKPVLETEGDVLGEPQLFLELAARLGVEVELPGGIVTSKSSRHELMELSYPNVRVPWEVLLTTEGGVVRPELSCVVEPADPTCTARLDVSPDGIAEELALARSELDSCGGIDGYDPEIHTFRLTSRRLKSVFNSSGREVEALRSKEGTNFAHVHPEDLRRLGIADGDVVEVMSPRSAVRTIAKASDDVLPGSVSMAHAWGDVPALEGAPLSDPTGMGATTGRLVDNASGYDPITGLPVQSAIPVALRRVS